MAIGVFEAIAQAKRSDIKFVVAGAGAKDMVKRVMDGDPMMPVDVLYSPTMVAVAMDVTALGLEEKIPVRGEYILKASLITKDNAKDFYFPNSPF
jgi:ribose transport system substrate-binding protein